VTAATRRDVKKSPMPDIEADQTHLSRCAHVREFDGAVKPSLVEAASMGHSYLVLQMVRSELEVEALKTP
jgi:hypothetical protein